MISCLKNIFKRKPVPPHIDFEKCIFRNCEKRRDDWCNRPMYCIEHCREADELLAKIMLKDTLELWGLK